MTDNPYLAVLLWAEEWAPVVELWLHGFGKDYFGSEAVLAGPVTQKFWEAIAPTIPTFPGVTFRIVEDEYLCVMFNGIYAVGKREFEKAWMHCQGNDIHVVSVAQDSTIEKLREHQW